MIIDPGAHWTTGARPGLPEWQSSQGHSMLALRWTGPAGTADKAPDRLLAAATRAPKPPLTAAELGVFRTSLEPGLHLIALPEEYVIGPWAQRPGAAPPTTRRAA